MLFFKRQFLPLIRAGTKTQTIRLWKSPRVKPGQRAFVPGLGHVQITHVDLLKRLSNLTPADARADGFASLRDLRAELRRLYPALGPHKSRHHSTRPKSAPSKTVPSNNEARHLYRIRFHFPAPDHPSPLPTPPRATRHKSRPAPLRPKKQSRPSKQALAHFLRALAPLQ